MTDRRRLNDPNATEADVAKAFAIGAIGLAAIMAAISLVVDPADMRQLGTYVAGSIVIGGGMAAAFTVPPKQYFWISAIAWLCSVVTPLGMLVAGQPFWMAICMGIALRAGIMALLTTILVGWQTVRRARRWLRAALGLAEPA